MKKCRRCNMWMHNSCLIFWLSQGNSSKSRITIQCEGPLKKPLLHSVPIVWPSTPCQSIFLFCERSIISLIPNTAQRSLTLSHHPTSLSLHNKALFSIPTSPFSLSLSLDTVYNEKCKMGTPLWRSRMYSEQIKFSFPHQKMSRVGMCTSLLLYSTSSTLSVMF